MSLLTVSLTFMFLQLLSLKALDNTVCFTCFYLGLKSSVQGYAVLYGPPFTPDVGILEQNGPFSEVGWG